MTKEDFDNWLEYILAFVILALVVSSTAALVVCLFP